MAQRFPTDGQAAWAMAEKQTPLEVGPGPAEYTLEANEVVIKVHYAAVNPTDPVMQDSPYLKFKYPWIFGVDVAGEILQLGSEVTRFNIGQRVMGHCDSLLTNQITHAGFQSYTICREILVAAVPDDLPLANAAVLPLSISTASSALFINQGLSLPSLNPKPTGKTVVLWGGSSSCGSSMIQLAVAAGYKVATTASSANAEYVKNLGATFVFDYKAPDVVSQIVKVFETEEFGGIVDCISLDDTQLLCAELLSRLGGGSLSVLRMPIQSAPENVTINFVNGLDPGLVRLDIGDAVWRKFVPAALAAGKLQAKPDALVLGGLEKVQTGIDMVRKGVSAQKIVIHIA
ncbi:zinc-binding oxidoreductase-like protein CipB [Thozetella sp. PMI_491]|nr:zinc-binding oxidoreductase-like protein CipB [Thozetella sp. PMI_491]